MREHQGERFLLRIVKFTKGVHGHSEGISIKAQHGGEIIHLHIRRESLPVLKALYIPNRIEARPELVEPLKQFLWSPSSPDAVLLELRGRRGAFGESGAKYPDTLTGHALFFCETIKSFTAHPSRPRRAALTAGGEPDHPLPDVIDELLRMLSALSQRRRQPLGRPARLDIIRREPVIELRPLRSELIEGLHQILPRVTQLAEDVPGGFLLRRIEIEQEV